MPETWATSGVDLHLDLSRAARARRAGDRAARRGADGAAAPRARGCRRRARWRPTWGSRATPWPTPTASWWPRAGSWPGADRARAWPSGRRRPRPPAASPGADAARPRHDLRPGSPDLSAFPRAAWLAASRRALNAAPYEALGYGDPRGRPELRRALAELSRPRPRRSRHSPTAWSSARASPRGWRCVCQALHSRGARTLAVEAYSQPPHRDVAIAGAGLDVRALPLDALGAVVGGLGRCRGRAADPGASVPARRAARAGPAHRCRGVGASGPASIVIEDDYDGEFRYDRQPVGAMQALAPEHVVYAGTASKTLAPGLRIGWLALPGPPRRRRGRRQGAGRPPHGRPRPADARRAHRERRLRPAHPPLPARLPAAPRPPRRRSAATRPAGGGHRRGRRPARRAQAAGRPGRAAGGRARSRARRRRRGPGRLPRRRPRPGPGARRRLRHPARPRVHRRGRAADRSARGRHRPRDGRGVRPGGEKKVRPRV